VEGSAMGPRLSQKPPVFSTLPYLWDFAAAWPGS
jgi:hypothetical protein